MLRKIPFLALFIGAIFLLATVASAQPFTVQPPIAHGLFVARWGDRPAAGRMEPIPPTYGIYQGSVFRPLTLSPLALAKAGGIAKLYGRTVDIYGPASTTNQSSIQADSVVPTISASDAPPALTGPQPWAGILCSFPGSPTPKPHPVSYYQGLYRSQYPSIEDYWEKLSNGRIFGLGPYIYGWYILPHNMAFYMSGGYPDLGQLWTDCTGKADADVNFPTFVGVNLFFDQDFGAAYGGMSELSLDGQTKSYRSTWMPNYDDPLNFLTHEDGHGFGRDHSCGSALPCDEYTDHTTQMSDISLKCDVVRDPVYGCIPMNMDSWDLYGLGWIDDLDVISSGYAETTIEPLVYNSGRDQAIKIPLSDTQSIFIEARKLTSYDAKLPTAGVILHAIDTDVYPFATFINVARNGDDLSKAAYLTKAGQKYTDPGNRFTVCLTGVSGSKYTIGVGVGVGVDCSHPPTVTPTSTPRPTATVTPTATATATPTPVGTPTITPTTGPANQNRHLYLPSVYG